MIFARSANAFFLFELTPSIANKEVKVNSDKTSYISFCHIIFDINCPKIYNLHFIQLIGQLPPMNIQTNY